MSLGLFLVQGLNGLQFGVLLFLVAAGLTLVFGVMDFINLAHGVQYMLGAYLGASLAAATGSFWGGLLLALPATLICGLVLEWLVFRRLYDRDHLSQVLATFGVILFLNEAVKVLWGTAPLQMAAPEALSGGITLLPGLQYPVYRLAILGAGLATAGLLWLLVERTKVGALVRAGATNAAMVAALGAWTERTRGVRLVGALGFENAYAFAMRGDDARRRGIANLDDLARTPGLALGSDLEFLERPEWAAVKRAYPLRFARTTPYSPTFMYRALESKGVDVISAFSSDGRIAADGLTVLSDPRHAIPGYDAVLLVAPNRSHDAKFVAALQPLVGRIPVEAMRAANYQVDRDTDKRTLEAAAQWLAAKVGL